MQRAVAVFCFLVRLYNVDEGRYQAALGKLAATRLTTTKLHEYFYSDFMLCCCSQ